MLSDLSFLQQYNDQKILIAPLNWGLGHAARCLPLIDYLTRENRLIIASDGLALEWLRKHDPGLDSLELPNYPIQYRYASMWRNMIRYGPGILSAIRQEHLIVKEWVKREQPDLIISDHRLGVRHKDVTSIFMAHQLIIPHPLKVVEKLASEWQKGHINRFDACWIPDRPTEPRLSGRLTNQKLGIPKYYLGPISRLQALPDTPIQYDLAVVLSGAEPARTHLEELLISSLKGLSLTIVVIRGTPKQPSSKFLSLSKNMIVTDLADTDYLNKVVNRASVILARSGYSTIMDLDVLRKKAILIPTPGQPEQEYLAELHKNRWLILHQEAISTQSLSEALRVLSK